MTEQPIPVEAARQCRAPVPCRRGRQFLAVALLWLVAGRVEAQTIHRLGTATFPSPAVSRPPVSADGQIVSFDSPAIAWGAGPATSRVVVVLNRGTGTASLQPWAHPSAQPLAGEMSSNGQVVAYSGSAFPLPGQLVWRDLTSGDAVESATAYPTHSAGISADGRTLLVSSARFTETLLSLLRRDGSTIADSEPVPLCGSASPAARGGTLSDDGQVVASLAGSMTMPGSTALATTLRAKPSIVPRSRIPPSQKRALPAWRLAFPVTVPTSPWA